MAVMAMPAVGSAHKGGHVLRQYQMVPPFLLGELAAASNQARRVSWRSPLVRLAVAQLVTAGLVRVLLDVLVAVAAAPAADGAPGEEAVSSKYQRVSPNFLVWFPTVVVGRVFALALPLSFAGATMAPG